MKSSHIWMIWVLARSKPKSFKRAESAVAELVEGGEPSTVGELLNRDEKAIRLENTQEVEEHLWNLGVFRKRRRRTSARRPSHGYSPQIGRLSS